MIKHELRYFSQWMIKHELRYSSQWMIKHELRYMLCCFFFRWVILLTQPWLRFAFITSALKIKFPLRSQIINFLKNTFWEISIYITINVSYEEICFEFERKNNTTLVFLLSNHPQVILFYDWPINRFSTIQQWYSWASSS